MFVDMLLKLLGENPKNSFDIVDKQAVLLEHGLNLLTYFLPVILLVVPVFWFFRKARDEKRKTKNIVIFLVCCVLFLVLGIVIPELIKNMLMGFAVTSLYGCQI